VILLSLNVQESKAQVLLWQVLNLVHIELYLTHKTSIASIAD